MRLPDKTAERPIAQLSLVELHDRDALLRAEADEIKAAIAEGAAEVTRRLGESAQRAYAEAGKESGALTLRLQGGLAAKCDIAKKIEWDSAKLLALAQTMPWDAVNRIFKIVFSVTETSYKGIAAVDPDMKAKLDAARTVTPAPVKITLVREAA